MASQDQTTHNCVKKLFISLPDIFRKVIVCVTKLDVRTLDR